MRVKNFLKNIQRVENEELDRLQFIRLDKNEGFLKFSNKFLNKCKKIINSNFLSTYPQPYLLRNELSKFLNIKNDELYLGSGSDALIKSVFEIFIEPNDEIIIPTPNYAMYYVYGDLFQANIKKIHYNNNTLKVDVQEILDNITCKTKMIFISNPNSPVGDLLTDIELLEIIKKALKFNIMVLIDEAYYPFSNFTMIDYYRKYSNLIIIRTFSKAFALASARLGYVIAQKEVIDYFKKVRPIYEVNSFAVAIGSLILKEYSFNKIYSEFIKIKKYFINELKKLNIEFIDTATNFLHIKIPIEKQNAFIKYMFDNKIILKKSGNQNFMNDYIRVSISNKLNMKIFIEKLKKFYKIL